MRVIFLRHFQRFYSVAHVLMQTNDIKAQQTLFKAFNNTSMYIPLCRSVSNNGDSSSKKEDKKRATSEDPKDANDLK